MKLFWREHTSLIFCFALQMILVPLLYALTGEGRTLAIMLYGVTLSGVMLVLYLGYHYISHRSMYKELSIEIPSVEFSNPPLGASPLPEAMHERISHLEYLYREQLQLHQNQTEQHLAFINRWVHQMKTPLSVIQLTLPELDDAHADNIREELDRIRKGLEMVIYTARLERFEQDFSVEAVNLRAAVNKVIVESRKLFIRKGITPEFNIDHNLAVYTDAKWFRFILDQILTNAVNYSGGPGKKITLTSEEMGENVKLHIRDQGIGISAEDIGRVFHPYFTGERGRQYHESTGMGLYLVREIAQRLSHTVELQSEPGKGTTVTLTLRKAVNPSTPQ
ncbi:MAG: sensor histidine kinase [Gorillibacterium sp.]|nr:sensor histidine kinase [Gorillibacterium sp.]